MARTPLWIFHGSNDSIIPIENDRDSYQSILRDSYHSAANDAMWVQGPRRAKGASRCGISADP